MANNYLRTLAMKIGWTIDDDALRKSDRATDKYKQKVDRVEDSIGSLGQEVARVGSKVERDFAEMGRAADTKLRHEADRAGQEIRSIGQDAQQAAQDVATATDKMKNKLQGLRDKINNLGLSEVLGLAGGGAAGSLLGADITTFAQLPREFQAQLGATEAIAQNLTEVTKSIWAEIPGISEQGAAEATATAYRYFDATGERARELGTYIAMLAEQSEVPSYRLGQAASIMENRFDDIKSPEQAFDILTKASQRLPKDIFEEFIDQTEEYGGNIAAAGLLANDFFSAMIDGGERSWRVMDTIGDSISTEMIPRILNAEEATMEALEALGGSATQANEWRDALAEGGEVGRSAIREIFTSLAELEDKQAQAVIGSAIMGEKYKDHQAEILPILENLGRGYADLGGEVDDLAVRYEGMLNKIKSGAKELRGTISEVGGGILGEIGEVVGAASPLLFSFGGALLANKGPLGTIKTVFGPVGKLASRFGGLASTVGTKALPVISKIGPWLLRLGGPIGWTVSIVGTLGVAIWKNWDKITEKTAWLKDSVTEFFGGMADGIRGKVNSIISYMNGLITGINNIDFKAPDWVPGIGGKGWSPSIPTIPMLAEGGRISAAGWTIVGEEGPELLRLDRGAEVQPLTAVSSFGEAPVFQSHVTVQYSGSGSRREMEELAAIIDRRQRQNFRDLMEDYWRVMSGKRPLTVER